MKEQLNKGREEEAFIEQSQAKMILKYVKQERKNFDFAEYSQWLAFDKKEEDLLVLSNTIIDWVDKLPENSTKKNSLVELLKSVFRVSSYCVNLETVVQNAVSKHISLKKDLDAANSSKYRQSLEFELKERDYKKKIEALEKEIEFLSK